MTDDMRMVVDLDEQYKFPSCLVVSDLRPDIVVYSTLTKSTIILELTVCFESNFSEAHQRKEKKYSELFEEVEANGYSTELITMEVGLRGFANYDSFKQLKYSLGASSKEIHDLLLLLAQSTIKSSFAIWTSRNHRNTDP